MKDVIDRALAGETVKISCQGNLANTIAQNTRQQVIDAAMKFTTRPIEVLIMGAPPNMQVWVRKIGEDEIAKMQQMSSDHPWNKTPR